MTQAVVLAQQASTGVSPGFRNRIINGGMTIDQRNAGASKSVTAGTDTYTLDRWYVNNQTDGAFTVQQDAGAVTPPVGFNDYLGITITTADSSLAAGQYAYLAQLVEGFNFADLNWGTANAKTVTFSFWVRSSLTGTFGGAFRNSGGSGFRSYPFTYTISVANTWEYKTITVAGDTSGTWVGATNGVGVQIDFGLGIGSTFSGTAGAWVGSNLLTATGATSVVGTNGATFYITGVQLEVGSTATSFEYLDYGRSLIQCQRYFEKSYDQGVKPGASGSPAGGIHSFSGWNVTGTTSYIGHSKVKYSVTKRATPTFSCWDNANPPNGAKTTRFTLGVGNNDNQNASLADAGDSGINVYSTGTTSNTGIIFHWTAEAEL